MTAISIFFIKYTNIKSNIIGQDLAIQKLIEITKKIKLGTWEKLEDGKDATIITYGDFIENAKEIKKINDISIKNLNDRIKTNVDSFIKDYNIEISDFISYQYYEIITSSQRDRGRVFYSLPNDFRKSCKAPAVLKSKIPVIEPT